MEYFGSDSLKLPKVGLGTASLKGQKCFSTVTTALDLGYRHIDTAQTYGNEREVGRAISSSSVDREEVILTTKLMFSNSGHEDVFSSMEKSLECLKTDYVDYLLIHSPSNDLDLNGALKAMERLKSKGVVKKIGVSNFPLDMLKEAYNISNDIKTNQVSYNPYKKRNQTLSFCKRNNMVLTAHSPLERGHFSRKIKLKRIGSRYNKTAAQVALRWLVQQQNVVAIPRSSDEKHLRENIDIFDFELSRSEEKMVSNMSSGLPYTIRRMLERFM